MTNKKPTNRATPAPYYVNADGLADALNISKRQVATLRHETWFPPALVFGPRSLRWDLAEVTVAMRQHAPRSRVGSEPAQLAGSRDNGQTR